MIKNMNKKRFSILVILLVAILGLYQYYQHQQLKERIRHALSYLQTSISSQNQNTLTASNESMKEEAKIDSIQVDPQVMNDVVNANNQLALNLYIKLKKEKGNIFFSPYSILTALATMQEGAHGKTAEEIQALLNINLDEAKRSAFRKIYKRFNQINSPYQIAIANGLWAQHDYKFLEIYKDVLREYYGAEAHNVDFKYSAKEAVLKINSWVANRTNNKIKNVIETLDPLVRLVFVNAAYFKAPWVDEFNKYQTAVEDFRVSPSDIVKVAMMKKMDDHSGTCYAYAETEDLQILEMDYKGGRFSMLIFLPKQDDLVSLENSFSIKRINEWRNLLKCESGNVFIPKFTMNYQYPLKEILEGVGASTMFLPCVDPLKPMDCADFSRMDGSRFLFINSITHQTFLNVDEEGTEAAAVTEYKPYYLSSTFFEFRADHPFIFLIQEKENGNILFLGRLLQP